jgi:hypothetical protein
LNDRASIRPGEVWRDTSGQRIQAHGGSILVLDDRFYWYGENKERTTPNGRPGGDDIWHWGIRCYSSTDLYNWTDEGIIIPPHVDDRASPLHPTQGVDRPHIIVDPDSGRLVCWIKVMSPSGQRCAVLVADDILGPWTLVRQDLKPLGMHAGDFDLVVDPADGKGYYYFERVHSELICADLTPDYTDVTGHYSTHFPRRRPPFVREAPAYFTRYGRHYLVTSGTTGYYPNPSEVAVAETYHGPWTRQGDAHPADESRTSFQTQISSVFKHPGKDDLYIALADRWLPHYQQDSSAAVALFDRYFGNQPPDSPMPELTHTDTANADYVWLPLRFDGDRAYLEWRDEWRIEDFG